MFPGTEECSTNYWSGVVLWCGISDFSPGYDPLPGSVTRKQISSALLRELVSNEPV